MRPSAQTVNLTVVDLLRKFYRPRVSLPGPYTMVIVYGPRARVKAVINVPVEVRDAAMSARSGSAETGVCW
jgi:hypothetical protein